jgi:hypothetical protein
MERKYYECDGGSLAIGTQEARSSFLNCYGDGEHAVEVYDKFEHKDYDNLVFRGAVQGTIIHVYDYDCLGDDECGDPRHILFTLSGRYGVYAREGTGDMILEKWD